MVSIDTTQNGAHSSSNGSFGRKLWIYGPLLAWMTFIFLASTDLFSASHTSSVLEPLLKSIFPRITENSLHHIHFLVRKTGHFSEYGLLALLTARAFRRTSRFDLSRHWFLWSLGFVALYSLTDEFHQSFVASRTASIYDSMIDTAGGATVLIVLLLLSTFRSRRSSRQGLMQTQER